MKITDLGKFRQQKQDAENAQSVDNAASALQNMKDDITVVLNQSIDSLVEAGMSEDQATMVVISYLGDLVMGYDLED